MRRPSLSVFFGPGPATPLGRCRRITPRIFDAHPDDGERRAEFVEAVAIRS